MVGETQTKHRKATERKKEDDMLFDDDSSLLLVGVTIAVWHKLHLDMGNIIDIIHLV
jgi:hypothetical protein